MSEKYICITHSKADKCLLNLSHSREVKKQYLTKKNYNKTDKQEKESGRESERSVSIYGEVYSGKGW